MKIPSILENFKTYCLNESCGDPVVGRDGTVYYAKREMNYAGTSFAGKWVYSCPCCRRRRYFKRSFFGDSINEDD